MSNTAVIQHIQSRYLNPVGADIWFIFDGERIPGHKNILASSPWLESMFFGSITETGEVDMSNSNVKPGTFKEFLRYIYASKPNFTMDNIDEMIYLADESLSQEIFDECENFLIKEITVDNLYFIYQLALRHERARRLKNVCEEEICVNAERTFKSASFVELRYEFLENILKCDSLVCGEKVIFDACIRWAKAACRRDGMDQYNPENLRAKLGASIYQIRFSSMTSRDAAACIESCPDLFSRNELQEIMCMIGRKTYSRTMQFNWAERYFSLQRNTTNELKCRRYCGLMSDRTEHHTFHTTEITKFTCNRRVFLKGFTLECTQPTTKAANITIIEMNAEEDTNIRYEKREMLLFKDKITRKLDKQNHISFEANVKLSNVLVRPGYNYELHITFENVPYNLNHRCFLKSKVRVDHDIVFRFHGTRHIVTSFTLGRLDNRKYLRRIIHDPWMWFMFFLMVLVVALIIRYDINQQNSTLVHLWHWLKSLFGKK